MARKGKHWLFNKQGLEWWHILIILGVLSAVFLLPFRKEVLTIYDVEWHFETANGAVIDPVDANALGGFGYTTNPERLEVASLVGTNMLAHPPYGPDSVDGGGRALDLVIDIPKSKVRLIHQNSCPEGASNDGVEVTTDNDKAILFGTGKEFITKKIIINPRTSPKCDWVWFSGFKQISIAGYYWDRWFSETTLVIPAQPFSLIPIEDRIR